MTRPTEFDAALGEAWTTVLEHISEAVLVLDSQRNLRFVNGRARRLLGYEDGQPLGSRCRLTTRGVDCENACPLSFALESRLDRVEDFVTVPASSFLFSPSRTTMKRHSCLLLADGASRAASSSREMVLEGIAFA